MTLVRLFSKDTLEVARTGLYQLYLEAGVPTTVLTEYPDAYLMFRKAYIWLEENKSPAEADAACGSASRILEHFEIDASQTAQLLPETKQTLEWLVDSGVRVAVVSMNSEFVVERVLKTNGVGHLVSATVGRCEGMSAKDMKPAPAVIFRALKLLACPGWACSLRRRQSQGHASGPRRECDTHRHMLGASRREPAITSRSEHRITGLFGNQAFGA